ncbi:MAG TPA: hypothetical protein VH393_13085 [Ktedonobacterales bacterium]
MDEDLRLLIVASVGPYDADDDTEYNLLNVEHRVKALVDDQRLSERFLIVALIREIEDTLADWLADAELGDQARGVLRVREVIRRTLEQATPQERHSPAFQQRRRHLEAFEASIYPTPERRAQRKRQLDTWRDVTRPLLESGATETDDPEE